MEHRILKLSGPPTERGRLHGQAMRDEIAALLAAHEAYLTDLIARRGGAALSPERLRAHSEQYLLATRSWAPHLAEEMAGIAEGAGVPLVEIVTLNAFLEWYDRTFPGVAAGPLLGGCTSLALGPDHTDQGGLLAQNYDLADVFPAGGVLLDIADPSGKRTLVATLPGVVGLAGLNSDGIGLVINKLVPRDAGPGVPYPVICRTVLEQSTLSQAVDQVIRPRRASGLHYLLMDGSGELLGVETSGTDFEVLYGLDDLIVHTNHYLSDRLRPLEAFKKPFAPDSITRFRRMARIARQLPRPVDPPAVQRLFADHHSSPCSICRHESELGQQLGPGHTIFSLVMEPARRQLWYCAGAPCAGNYVPLEVS